MIKSLQEARMKDALPRVLVGQEWVSALSDAIGTIHDKEIEFTDESQIYTAIDTAPEIILDILAINWKVDWYDTDYSIEQKRRIIKTALTSRRKMGTYGAVRLQAEAIYQTAKIKEWFDFGGTPGYFRLYLDEGVTIAGLNGLWRAVQDVKRLSAWLEQTEITIHPGEDAVLRTGGRMGAVSRLPMPLIEDSFYAERTVRLGGRMAAEGRYPIPEEKDEIKLEDTMYFGGGMVHNIRLSVAEIME